MSGNSMSPWPYFSQEEAEVVSRVLLSNKVNYWTGNECRSFEKEFSEFCGTEYGVAVANGTVALELALEAGGIGPGCDVIVAPRTFIASASCIVRRGARPVFADISPESQNITVESIRAALSPATRAIVAVHHAGWPCDMEAIMQLADEHSLYVVEDCAQAHGARIGERSVGSFGDVGTFSFCQDKIMTTGGEGGMLVTSNRSVWSRAWSIKDHGKDYDSTFNGDQALGFRWLHESFGTNYRMTEMQAALGRYQLSRVRDWVRLRNSNAQKLIETISDFPVLKVAYPKGNVTHAYYRLYAFVDEQHLADGWNRDRIAESIKAAGVPCLVGSCPEIYNEKAFELASLRPRSPMPVARSLGPRSLAFLVHPTLSHDDIARMCVVLRQTLGRATRSTDN